MLAEHTPTTMTFEELFKQWQTSPEVIQLLTQYLQQLASTGIITSSETYTHFSEVSLCLEFLMRRGNGEFVVLPEQLAWRDLNALFPPTIVQAFLNSLPVPVEEVSEPVQLEPVLFLDGGPEQEIIPVTPRVPRKRRTRQAPPAELIEFATAIEGNGVDGEDDDLLDDDDDESQSLYDDDNEPNWEDLAEFDGAEHIQDEELGQLAFQYDSIGQFLKDIMRFELLSAEEEISLAERILAGKEAAALREKMLKKETRSAEQEETVRRCEHTMEDGQWARQHLAACNTRLVVSIAKHYMNRGVLFPDLIQEGTVGLMKAVDKYDSARGYRFSTYATWWIRQTVTRGIADNARVIRVPVHMGDKIRHLNKIERALEQELGYIPSVEQLAYELLTEQVGYRPTEAQLDSSLKREFKLKIKTVTVMLNARMHPVSLDAPMKEEDEDGMEFGDAMFDEQGNTEVVSGDHFRRQQILKIVEQLGDVRQIRIIKYRFGLVTGVPLTLEQVALKFGLTRERIRQLEVKALRRLRHPRYSRQIRDYVYGI